MKLFKNNNCKYYLLFNKCYEYLVVGITKNFIDFGKTGMYYLNIPAFLAFPNFCFIIFNNTENLQFCFPKVHPIFNLKMVLKIVTSHFIRKKNYLLYCSYKQINNHQIHFSSIDFKKVQLLRLKHSLGWVSNFNTYVNHCKRKQYISKRAWLSLKANSCQTLVKTMFRVFPHIHFRYYFKQ